VVPAARPVYAYEQAAFLDGDIASCRRGTTQVAGNRQARPGERGGPSALPALRILLDGYSLTSALQETFCPGAPVSFASSSPSTTMRHVSAPFEGVP
jgi:hypothetical protein